MKLFILKRWGQSEFLMNLIKLITGTLIAQLIPFLASPLLTRMFSPEQFGEYALYISILSPVTVIIAGRYEMAIMLPQKESEAVSIVNISILFTLFTTLLLLILFYISIPFIANLAVFNDVSGNSLKSRILWIPLAAALVSVSQITMYWLNRKKAFTQNSINRIFQTGSFTFLNLITGTVIPLIGFIVPDFVSRLFTALFSFIQLKKSSYKFNSFNTESIQKTAKKYKEFPLYNSWAALLDSISSYLPVIIIGSTFSLKATGYFNFSRQIIGLPMMLIAQSISQVYYQQLYEQRKLKLPILPTFIKLTKMLTILSVIYFAFILLTSDLLFTNLFGQNWKTSGFYSRLIVLSISIKFIVIPLLMCLPAVNAVRTDSFLKILYFISMACLYLFRDLNIEDFLLIYCGIEVIVYMIRFMFVWFSINKYDKLHLS